MSNSELQVSPRGHCRDFWVPQNTAETHIKGHRKNNMSPDPGSGASQPEYNQAPFDLITHRTLEQGSNGVMVLPKRKVWYKQLMITLQKVRYEQLMIALRDVQYEQRPIERAEKGVQHWLQRWEDKKHKSKFLNLEMVSTYNSKLSTGILSLFFTKATLGSESGQKQVNGQMETMENGSTQLQNNGIMKWFMTQDATLYAGFLSLFFTLADLEQESGQKQAKWPIGKP